MLIVIVIIGILAWALIPRIGTARDKANDTAREANVRSLATAMVQYWLDHGSYPESVYDNKWGWRLINYGISDSFDWQPTDNDYYAYLQLDGGSHFVFLTKLSEWSEAWNCNVKIDCGDSPGKPLNICHFEAISVVVEGIVEGDKDYFDYNKFKSYNDWNSNIIHDGWNWFCYLQ